MCKESDESISKMLVEILKFSKEETLNMLVESIFNCEHSKLTNLLYNINRLDDEHKDLILK